MNNCSIKSKKLLFATNNKHKLQEVRDILATTAYEIYGINDLLSYEPEIEENGNSFAENSFIKLRYLKNLFPSYAVIADDSGLCVDALNGAPGIYSARFAGKDSTYEEKFARLFSLLDEKKILPQDRYASFVCNIAYIDENVYLLPDSGNLQADINTALNNTSLQFFEGECQGLLIAKGIGDKGFGYDPIMYIPEYGMTLAQMPSELKNKISHRYCALNLLQEFLNNKK